jgi:S-formylglutathione hydrolase FrmB
LPANRDFYQFLKERHADVTYSEWPGTHEWNFWNTYIQKILDWLPLDDHVNDVSSGNVK